MVDPLNMASSLPLAPTLGPLVREGGAAPRQALDRLASDGFRHVQFDATTPGLRPRELDKSARRDVLAVLRRLELTLSGIDIWIPAERFLDASTIDRATAAMKQAIALAADLNRCPVSCTFPPSNLGDEQLAAAIDEIAREANRQGARLADHAVPPLAHEHIGVGIDPAAWLANNQDPSQAAVSHASRLISARASNLSQSGQRTPVDVRPGDRFDLLSYRLALAGAGYERPVVLDLRQIPDAWQGLTQGAQAWSAI